jgi:hypothetical protein
MIALIILLTVALMIAPVCIQFKKALKDPNGRPLI